MRELDQGGITVRCITIGSQAKAEEFCARHNPAAQCIGDADMHTYKAMGITDFDLTQLKTFPGLQARRDENEAAGFRQDWDATRIEDAAQNPGAAVIAGDGRLLWIHRGIHPGDLPPMADMIARARAALGA